MPKTDVHIEASAKKTGKSHQAVHAFVDFEKKEMEGPRRIFIPKARLLSQEEAAR